MKKCLAALFGKYAIFDQVFPVRQDSGDKTIPLIRVAGWRREAAVLLAGIVLPLQFAQAQIVPPPPQSNDAAAQEFIRQQQRERALRQQQERTPDASLAASTVINGTGTMVGNNIDGTGNDNLYGSVAGSGIGFVAGTLFGRISPVFGNVSSSIAQEAMAIYFLRLNSAANLKAGK
jgi:hypothetical protein